MDGLTWSLPADLRDQVKAELQEWEREDRAGRLWQRDASLWTGGDEASWLGWLDVRDQHLMDRAPLEQLLEEARPGRWHSVLLLGMGGSSLFPEVLQKTLGNREAFPKLRVLDSTDPDQVSTFRTGLDLPNTLFIVSSKSGSTLEPDIFLQYFYHTVRGLIGAARAGEHFIAITDPGSKLERAAREMGFRDVFHGVPSIGGRYSALSAFGLVPAALLGHPPAELLDPAGAMARDCSRRTSAVDNPGVALGAVIGVAARMGRDKLTMLMPAGLSAVGAWLEQLLAESTGKDGKAVIPVEGEAVGPPDVYSDDRLFVYMSAPVADEALETRVQDLERAGQPVVRIPFESLGREVFRWEFATAVAGSILKINPFNQPDVEASKIATRDLMEAYEREGSLPEETPMLCACPLELYGGDEGAAGAGVAGVIRAHLDSIGSGDYFAILAYVEMNEQHDRVLQSIRIAVRDSKKVATCVEYGPRFLHSTGQAYKGGPDSGVFLQITCDDLTDLMVPNRRYSFGVVKAAQAQGDLQVLRDRGRRALRVHISGHLGRGLAALEAAVRDALR